MRQYILLILFLAAVALLGIGGALWLSLNAPGNLQYEQEWVRALLQIGLIAVLGVVTSGVLEQFKAIIQQHRDESKLRLDVLNEISHAYMDVKLARRKIQAGNTFTATEMDILNQKQIIFEMHMHNSVRLFRQGDKLEGYLKAMEHYLNKVANEPDSPERHDFHSNGFKAFSKAFGEATRLMRVEIAGR